MVQVRQQSHMTAAATSISTRGCSSCRWTLDELTEHTAGGLPHGAGALAAPGHDAGDWAQESNCFLAGLDIALILADLQVGLDCLLAGILYRACESSDCS